MKLGRSSAPLKVFFLLLLNLCLFQSVARADHYDVVYNGRSYDSAQHQTTFSYTVSGKGQSPALSHFTAGLPKCTPELQIVSTSPQTNVFGEDPTTSVFGIKWDFGLGTNETLTYSYTVAGDIAEGPVTLAIKAGRDVHYVSTLGAACPGGTNQCNTDPCNLGDASCQNGETEVETVPQGQICTFQGTIRNVGDISAITPELTANGNGCTLQTPFAGCGEQQWTISDCSEGDVTWISNDTSWLEITDIDCCEANQGQSCSRGQGVCTRTGVIQCDGSCSAQAGQPNPEGEICDNNLDDDCDGLVDEVNCQALASISGTAFLEGTSTVVPGVTISSDGGLGATSTDGNGDYGFTDVPDGAYILTAIKEGYVVVSDPNPVIVAGAPQTDQDFILACATGYQLVNGVCVRVSIISGTTTFVGNGAPIADVSISGGSLGGNLTDGAGMYVYNGVLDGSYTLLASKPGYIVVSQSFSNPVTVNGADQLNKDFVLDCAEGFVFQNGECQPEGPQLVDVASDGTFRDYVLVTWNPIPGATSYTIYRSETEGPLGEQIGGPVSGTSFRDETAIPDKFYYYTVISDTGVESNQDLGWRPGGADVCQEGDECIFQQLEPFACASANGFLGQINIATVINRHSEPLQFTVEYRDLFGVTQGQVVSTLAPFQKSDFIVNDLGLALDTYGTVCVSVDTDLLGAWSGGVSLYKPDMRNGVSQFGEGFDFVLRYPFTNPLSGSYTLPLNTFHLGVRSDATVANWIRITDAEDGDNERLKGSLHYFDQNGKLINTVAVDLPDGGRFDFSGHEGIAGLENRDAVGMARFVPNQKIDGSEAKYYISLGRYYYQCFGATCNDFYTAFIVPHRPATSIITNGGVSTVNGEISIVEMNNIGEEAANAELLAWNSSGSLAGESQEVVSPFATKHVIVNQVGETGFLAANSVGTASVQPQSGLLSAVSIFYKLSASGELEYAYSAPFVSSPAVTQLSEYNSFIGHRNHAEIYNSSDEEIQVELVANDFKNETVLTRNLVLGPKATERFELELPENTFGTIAIQTSAEGIVFRNYVSRDKEYVLPFIGR